VEISKTPRDLPHSQIKVHQDFFLARRIKSSGLFWILLFSSPLSVKSEMCAFTSIYVSTARTSILKFTRCTSPDIVHTYRAHHLVETVRICDRARGSDGTTSSALRSGHPVRRYQITYHYRVIYYATSTSTLAINPCNPEPSAPLSLRGSGPRSSRSASPLTSRFDEKICKTSGR
jgi:hypothetical protein